MNQYDQGQPNRAARRKAERELRRAMKTGVGVDARLAGFRVVRPDGTIKIAAGRQPREEQS